METTEQKFDLEYFVSKFEAIPDDQWITGEFFDERGCKCAYGHCGAVNSSTDTIESSKLLDLDLEHSFRIAAVNDNTDNEYSAYGSTPKQRVVNYLKSLRDA